MADQPDNEPEGAPDGQSSLPEGHVYASQLGLDGLPVTYGVAATRDLREQAYRLIQQNLVRTGKAESSATPIRVTRYNLTPEAITLVACFQGAVISTVTLVADGPLGLPLEGAFGSEVAALRRQGRKIAEVIGFANRRKDLMRGLPVILGMTRLVTGLARSREIGDLLMVDDARNRWFFERYLRFAPLGSERSHPAYRGGLAVAFRMNLVEFERKGALNLQAFAEKLNLQGGKLVVPPNDEADNEYFRQFVDGGSGNG